MNNTEWFDTENIISKFKFTRQNLIHYRKFYKKLYPNEIFEKKISNEFYKPSLHFSKNFIDFIELKRSVKKNKKEKFLIQTNKKDKIDLQFVKYELDRFYKYMNEILVSFNSEIEFYKSEKHKIDLQKNESVECKTYLMKDTTNNFYKIGYSTNPEQRESTLQSEKPTIKMVKVWDKFIEKELHEKYKDQRVRGEWFKLTPTQVKYICTHY